MGYNAAITTNLITVNESPNGTGGVLKVTNIGPGNVHGWIPAGKYVRIRTVAASGTPTFTYVRGGRSASIIVIHIISRRPEYQPGGDHKHQCNPTNCQPHRHPPLRQSKSPCFSWSFQFVHSIFLIKFTDRYYCICIQ